MEADRLRRIVASAQTGCADGFNELLEAYGPRLLAYFFRATGDQYDAEDLLGELTLRLVRRLPQYVHRGRFDQWLFRIAANMVRDRIRRRKASPGVLSLADEDAARRALSDRIAAGGPATEAPVMAAEAAEQLQAALEKLDERTKQMILLRHFGEMSFKEIAEIFECPLGTVLARVHRGLRTLRRLIGEDDGPS